MSQGEPVADRNVWIENVFRPLVIAVMIGCVGWSLGQFAAHIAPSLSPVYFAAGCVLVALEAYYSHRLLRAPWMLGTDVLRYRVIELLSIFILLKLIRHASRGASDMLAEIQTWPHDPLRLLDLETLVVFGLALLFWWAVTQTARDLDSIGEPPERRENAVSPVERLTSRFFFGGALLVITAGLTYFDDPSELLNLGRPAVAGLVLNALIYFLLGLAMLGQIQFLRWHTEWQRRLMAVSDDVPGRWVLYSLAFIVLAALLAFVLPTGFALSPLITLSNYLGVVGEALMFIVLLLFAILSLPFSLLAWLLSKLSGKGVEQPLPQVALPSFQPSQQQDAGGTANWFEIARMLIFWLVLLGGAFFVLRSYLRDRPEIRQAVLALRPIQTLRRGMAVLWRWLRGWAEHLGQAVSERLPRGLPRQSPRDTTTVTGSFRFFRLGALSPRERVLYYYLSIVRRAGREGLPRQNHQTPHEYGATLAPRLPEAQEDLGALTQAFVEARYSQHEIGTEQDRRVRTNWERVKGALRAVKRLKSQ